ncbi:MAG: permease-like cell division protein FtsX, partial [Bacteroidota bacterium]
MEKSNQVRKKKRLGSYPSVSVVFSITLALAVIGLFGLLLIHTTKLTTVIKENVEIQIYLQKDITQNQRIQIQKTLSSKDYTQKKGEEIQIRFISKDEAAKELIDATGEDFLDFLGENPLKDAFVLKIKSEYYDNTSLSEIKADIEKINGVFEVEYLEKFIESINKNTLNISIFLLAFAVILILAVVILINNTIKLALFSQRFLIRSMQLVGAKNGFIQKPFLMRASLYGFMGGVFAILLLIGLISFLNNWIEGLQELQEPEKILILFAGLIFVGVLIGFL